MLLQLFTMNKETIDEETITLWKVRTTDALQMLAVATMVVIFLIRE